MKQDYFVIEMEKGEFSKWIDSFDEKPPKGYT
jgi:hypothetical protein